MFIPVLYFEEVQSIGGVLLSYPIFHMISLWLVDEATGRYVLEYFLLLLAMIAR